MIRAKGMLVATSALLAVVLTLGACTTVDPYTREEKTSNATKGAAIGAAAGAVAGAVSGDDSHERKKRALIGAGIGAIAGGSVGYYMDVQEAKLRKRLEGTGVSVTRDGNNVILNMPGNVTFDVDSANIRPQFTDVLDSVSEVLNEYEKTLIAVAGHTDSTGSAEYNQELSERRATSVANYLRTKGIDGQRFLIIGHGESRPIASNDTPEGRQQNRRVELTLEPLTD